MCAPEEIHLLPTLKEEVDRKAFETVEWLFTSLDKGKLTAAQFSTGIDTLFMAVNGLVNEGVADLITAADFEARHEIHTISHVYIKGGNVITLSWVIGNELVEIVAYVDGVEKTRQDKFYDSPKEARESMQKAGAKFVAAGYTKL
jgi:hypothetical protein